MAPFEVVGFSSMDELRARIAGPEVEWPDDVPWLPAGATAADEQAGRVRLDLRVGQPWARAWSEVEQELARLARVMGVLVTARQRGQVIPVELWDFTRGVHRATAWTLGVTTAMPLDAGTGPVTGAAIERVHEVALALTTLPVERWDGDGVVEWLAWLDGETDAIPYPLR